MAFKNNELSMNGQVLCISSEIVQSAVAECTKMLETLILSHKSNQSDFRRKFWVFYVCMF